MEENSLQDNLKSSHHYNHKTILKVIMILSIIGFLVSLYLIKGHYASPDEGLVCDFNQAISCSAVEAGKYSTLLGVPVAVFGAMWFLVLLALAWMSLEKERKLLTFLFSWSILGILFVVYMIIAEIMLQVLCPFCTVIHLLVVLALVLSWSLYKAQDDPTSKSFLKIPKNWFRVIILINLVIIFIFNWVGRFFK